MKDNLLTWWNGLAYREQQLVAVCSIFLIIGIFYWGIWSPISNAEQDAQRRLVQSQKTLSYVKQSVNKIVAAKQSGQTSTRKGSLSSIVNTIASRYGVVISRMQPQGKKVQIWMDDVPFNDLLAYLNELTQNQGLSLDTFDVTETETAGLVKVRRIQLSQ
ncbi:type II secretion system protein M [Parashewanella spongiae]|uniref:Type II secretion system protein M n=1 Tax=Parashewanella spongiae TaxID=342950 RepID=A0A3A6U3Y2_9GAMM|nr:type II secretion system protein M [Parashewanella spongiae]MCL1077155.1 type II secretion system protein M [Parashewanella spongiae]RJY18822.1 type II secretion system protein M [Parashewanella spongiae]